MESGNLPVDPEYLRILRRDLAALCCAGAYVAQPDIWQTFITWVKEHEPRQQEFNFSSEAYAGEMKMAVLRTDRMALLTLLLTGPDDQEIQKLLEGEI